MLNESCKSDIHAKRFFLIQKFIDLEQGGSVFSSAQAKLSSSISGNSVSVFVTLLDFITGLNQIYVLFFFISGFHIAVLFNLSKEMVYIPSNTTK
jgi:hypothetical protein